MKKLLFVLPIIALLAAGCNSSQQASVQTKPLVTKNTNPSMVTYASDKYGYEIEYPNTFQ